MCRRAEGIEVLHMRHRPVRHRGTFVPRPGDVGRAAESFGDQAIVAAVHHESPRVAAVVATQLPEPPPEPVEGQLALRLLVVDNEAGVLHATRQLLEGWGVEVRGATGPDEALALAEGFAPQAWLLDYHLDDGATGAELHRRLAARFPAGFGLVLSADHGEAVRAAVLAAGAQPLTKPLRPLRLRSLLQRRFSAG